MPDPTPPEPRSLLVSAADRRALSEESARHPLNPRCEIHGHALSRRTGLRRVGVNLIRIPPGKESTAFHVHWNEEEFAFVLSGRGVAEVGDQQLEIGPGDFLGFPPGTHAHAFRNTGTEDLVFLAGGESRELEVADFPREGKRVVRIGESAALYPIAGAPFPIEGAPVS